MKLEEFNAVPESLRKNIEFNQKIADSAKSFVEKTQKLQEVASSILERQNTFQQIVDRASPNLNIDNSSAVSMLDSFSSNKYLDGLGSFAVETANFGNTVSNIVANYNVAITNIATTLTNLVSSQVMNELQTVTSKLGDWLRSIDFTPLVNIIESIQDCGFEYDYDYVDELYLKAMFDARWFPYAAWMADFRITGEIFDILQTSRVSKNRVKRIDKVLFSYYNKDELNNLKRGWRQLNVPSYMTRILIQSIQAYNRREYAWTVSALSTLWEGIIQEKVNDSGYRVSKKTRENLNKLIEENEFDEIFVSFCDEFIFYNCTKPEEVKLDVPGRHGIAHCWYDTYPNRKVALNAIIFTDFLLRLKPLDKNEDIK